MFFSFNVTLERLFKMASSVHQPRVGSSQSFFLDGLLATLDESEPLKRRPRGALRLDFPVSTRRLDGEASSSLMVDALERHLLRLIGPEEVAMVIISETWLVSVSTRTTRLPDLLRVVLRDDDAWKTSSVNSSDRTYFPLLEPLFA